MIIEDFGYVYNIITHRNGKHIVMFRCECGNEWRTSTGTIDSAERDNRVLKCRECKSKALSARLTKHGGVGTRLYKVWEDMKSRCHNKNNKNFKHYGGRGIKISKEWLDFAVFRAWSNANGYSDALTIERVDVNKGYNSKNCTWIPLREQGKNRRMLRVPKTGEHYIYPAENGKYAVQVKRKTIAYFSNIDEAIKCRDDYINTHLQ